MFLPGMDILEVNEENNSIHNNTLNKTFRNKFNQGGERHVHQKLLHC
jgi:hypothetical protein